MNKRVIGAAGVIVIGVVIVAIALLMRGQASIPSIVVPYSTVNCPHQPLPYPSFGTVLPPTPAPMLPRESLAFSFADTHYGWAALEGIEEYSGTSQIWATTDGGETWIALTRLDSAVVALDFISPQQGWAISANALLTSDDGGKTWRTVSLPEGEHARHIDFVDARYGWIAGDACANAVLQTTNSGQSWSALPVPCEENGLVEGFAVTVPGSGWLLCNVGNWDGKLWRTMDAGAHWQLVNTSHSLETPVPNAYPFVLTPHPTQDPTRLLPDTWKAAGMSFADDEYGWISFGGQLWSTSDGGLHWQPVTMSLGSVQYGPASAPRLISSTQGYVLSRTYTSWGVFGTKDGGQTWTHLFPRARP